ncbi:MAG: hypothetical protein ACJ738_02935 [Gaiellales bacterium]|jgi:hypothetical protein
MTTNKLMSRRFRRSSTLAAAVVLACIAATFILLRNHSAQVAPTVTKPTKTWHYAPNTGGRIGPAAADGFTLFDIAGSTRAPQRVNAIVNRLPRGAKALVWVGNLGNTPAGSSCPPPGFSMQQFTAQVDAIASNSKVFGYYLSDEPHPSLCPTAVSEIAARADYIHSHTSQVAFIVALDSSNVCGEHPGCEYRALAPSHTHVDLIGLDPYPCHLDAGGAPAPCDVGEIASKVNTAIRSGIPRRAIVPTFQTFGQEGRTDGKAPYYRLPTAGELTTMLHAWSLVVPAPAMDYSYTFGVQCTRTNCPAPQAIENQPALAPVIKRHNDQR